jgi:hypothetical protein
MRVLQTVLDPDKIFAAVMPRISKAVRGWVRGRILDEPSLMSRIVESFTDFPEECEVGYSKPIRMRSEWAVLHRKGESQTDAYGADLAVTIYVEELNYVKTALIQTKIGSEYKAKVEKAQLDEAMEYPQTRDRSFVCAVDKETFAVRFADVQYLLGQFGKEAKTKTFNTSVGERPTRNQWRSLNLWIWHWINCGVGAPSAPGDPNSIESLLRGYMVESSLQPGAHLPWETETFAIPDDESRQALPETPRARTWLMFLFGDPQSRWMASDRSED